MAIIDRRQTANRDRTSENRGRLLRRHKAVIKEQLPRILGGKKLKDIASDGGTVVLPKKSMREPWFTYGEGGTIDRVLPGNDQWQEYDMIDKPPPGGGMDSSAGEGEDGEDDFRVILSKEEFLNILFEDCELPFMAESMLHKHVETFTENAGFQTSGAPNRLSLYRTYKVSKARRIAVGSMFNKQVAELEEELSKDPDNEELKAELATLKRKAKVIPMFDPSDMRYRSRLTRTKPKTHATVFMLMDNSGSMGEREKTIARKFFILLYLFLNKNYETIDLRFISHTTEAEELTEEQFFNTHVNGGTIVSSALDLLVKLIEPLRDKTNIYVAQVSDGDNVESDNGTCNELLTDDILPYVNFYAFMQVDGETPLNGLISYHTARNTLWNAYEDVASRFKNLSNKRVSHERDIYSVFRKFFTKETS